MDNNIGFKGGIPYGLDVRRLSDAFPVPSLNEGRVLRHAELEEVLGYKRGTQRYYGVVNAWLNKQKADHGLILVWVPSEGVKVLDPAGVLEHAEIRTKQKSRQLQRQIKMFGWVDRARLDTVGQKRLDHQLTVAAKLSAAVGDARKGLAVELAPIKSMPKRIASTCAGWKPREGNESVCETCGRDKDWHHPDVAAKRIA